MSELSKLSESGYMLEDKPYLHNILEGVRERGEVEGSEEVTFNPLLAEP